MILYNYKFGKDINRNCVSFVANACFSRRLVELSMFAALRFECLPILNDPPLKVGCFVCLNLSPGQAHGDHKKRSYHLRHPLIYAAQMHLKHFMGTHIYSRSAYFVRIEGTCLYRRSYLQGELPLCV